MNSQPSPTLQTGQDYLSVLAPVPAGLSQKIQVWQQRVIAEQTVNLHSHITVLVSAMASRVSRESELLAQLQEAVQIIPAFGVRLGEPASFEPVTAVTYLPVVSGQEELAQLHQILQEGAGESASPFPYVPHVTLAGHQPPQTLAASLHEFSGLSKEDLEFSITTLEVYLNTGGSWQYVGNLNLPAG